MSEDGRGPAARPVGRLPRVEADPTQPLALAFDASGPVEVLAVVQGNLLLGQVQARRSRAAGDTLAEAVTGLMASVGRCVQDLDVIACVIGPGAFTGVRVGIATAEGLSDGLGIPAFGYLSTDGWAWAGRDCGAPVAVTLDARRGEVYTALYESTAGQAPRRLDDVGLELPSAWFERLAGCGLVRTRLVGDGAVLYADLAREILGEVAWLDPLGPTAPDLCGVARDALVRLGARDPGDSAALRPLYLRAHDGSRVAFPAGLASESGAGGS